MTDRRVSEHALARRRMKVTRPNRKRWPL